MENTKNQNSEIISMEQALEEVVGGGKRTIHVPLLGDMTLPQIVALGGTFLSACALATGMVGLEIYHNHRVKKVKAEGRAEGNLQGKKDALSGLGIQHNQYGTPVVDGHGIPQLVTNPNGSIDTNTPASKLWNQAYYNGEYYGRAAAEAEAAAAAGEGAYNSYNTFTPVPLSTTTTTTTTAAPPSHKAPPSRKLPTPHKATTTATGDGSGGSSS